MWVDLKAGRPNVLLFGPVGTGKSYTAVAALRPLYDTGLRVAFWPVTTFLEATSPAGLDPAGAMESATQADVLVLDDLGTERDTEWVAERVYEVVNSRWLAEVPTIVTTNATDGPALAEAIGPRVYSRLQDGAIGHRLGGPDRRRSTP
jgi:DNA replication protein DnaC